MAPNFLTAIELIAVLTIYCAALCPILCWVISLPIHPDIPISSPVFRKLRIRLK